MARGRSCDDVRAGDADAHARPSFSVAAIATGRAENPHRNALGSSDMRGATRRAFDRSDARRGMENASKSPSGLGMSAEETTP